MNVPTTMLGAVNELLTAVGTVPVNTLDSSGLTDAAIAADVIESVGREVQSRGWWFNTSRRVALTATTVASPEGGSITGFAVPANAMQVSPAMPTATEAGEVNQFVTRSNLLFNIKTNSYTFGAVTTLYADITYLFEFEKLPEVVRRYITVRAARIFQTKVLGDESLGVFNSVHESEAFDALHNGHLVGGPSTLYLDRMRQRFAQSRQGPIGHGPRPAPQQQQG